jgi:hypothetical protein
MRRRAAWGLAAGLLLLGSACGGDGADEGEVVAVLGAELEADGRTLHLTLDACGSTEQEAEVAETTADIRVTVRVKGATGEDCEDSDEMTVLLNQPFARRSLADTSTGDEIPLERV